MLVAMDLANKVKALLRNGVEGGIYRKAINASVYASLGVWKFMLSLLPPSPIKIKKSLGLQRVT